MIGKVTADHCLNSTGVQKLIHRNDTSFDLVINQEFFMESLSMFAYKYKAPLITISEYNCGNKSHGFSFFINTFMNVVVQVHMAIQISLIDSLDCSHHGLMHLTW